jgi:hypothetical protein
MSAGVRVVLAAANSPGCFPFANEDPFEPVAQWGRQRWAPGEFFSRVRRERENTPCFCTFRRNKIIVVRFRVFAITFSRKKVPLLLSPHHHPIMPNFKGFPATKREKFRGRVFVFLHLICAEFF